MGQITVEKNAGGIEGLCVITPTVHGDARGYFMETYNQNDMAEAGLTMIFVQDNQSCSTKGVLRGLHFQKQFPQGKLVRVIRGEVFDVAVDLREGSATYKKWFGIRLSEENKKQFYIPEGFAHGFLVLNDPEIGVEWPEIVGEYDGTASAEGYRMTDGTKIVMSEKDQKWGSAGTSNLF